MKKLLLAACSLALNPNSDSNLLVLVPEGEFRGVDGRPTDAPCWVLTPENGKTIVVALNQMKIDSVIDYEHSTLLAKKTGAAAPASGWCVAGQFEYVTGVGICSSKWQWTDTAADQIEKKEYRYLSPVFAYEPGTGKVVSYLCAALTNTPCLDVLPEVLAAAAQEYLSTEEGDNVDELLERLRWMLNLPISATAEEIQAELVKLTDQISTATGVTVAANSKNLFDALGAIDTRIAALSQQAPDPSKFVPISMFNASQAQVAELTQAAAEVDLVEPLILAALADGRLLETNTEHLQWARDYGKQDPEGLKRHLEAAPRIVALTQRQTQTTNIAANSQQHGDKPVLDDVALAICAQMGNDPAEVLKHV